MTARRRGVSALALLFAAAAQWLLCVDAQLQISGQGATTLTPLMNIINFGFRSVNPDVVVTYTGTGSGAGRGAVSGATQPPSDFAGSNVVFTEGDVATSRKLQRAAPWSLIASTSAIVVAYTLPELGNAPKQLVIDRATLVAIFNLTVKFWDDPAITSLQPPSVAALLPHQRINIVYRSDRSGTTNTFLQALNKFDSKFTPKPTDDNRWNFYNKSMKQCPPLVLNVNDPAMQGYACEGKGSDQVAAQIAFHPYSLGYLSLTSITAALTPTPTIPRPQQYFAMINRAGKTVDATTEACQEALSWGMKSGSAAAPGSGMASYTSPTGDLANGIDAPTPGAWPILEYNFLLVPDLLAVDCARSLQIAQYLIWSIESATAQAAMVSLGYSPIPPALADPVIEKITQLKCGTPAAVTSTFDSLFADEDALRVGSYVACALLCLVGALAFSKRSHPAVLRDGPYVMIFIAFGAAANCLTVSAYIGYPTQTVCALRPWLLSLQLVTVGGLFITHLKLRLKNHEQKLATKGSGHMSAADAAMAEFAGVELEWEEFSLAKWEKEQAALANENLQEVAQPVTLADVRASSTLGSCCANSVSLLCQWARSKGGQLVLICAAVAFAWLLLPVTWTLLEPPFESRRKCLGAYNATFQALHIVFNVALIVATAVLAHKDNVFPRILFPLFTMCFVIALFTPISFVRDTSQFIARQTITVALQPAIGIVIGTFVQALMILLPPLIAAVRFVPADFLIMMRLEKDIVVFKQLANMQLRQSKRDMSVDNAASNAVVAALST